MKIPPAANHVHGKSPTSNRTTTTGARGASQLDEVAADDATSPSERSEGRDFASVLEDVSRPDERREERDEGDRERNDTKHSERAEREAVERRDERREEGSERGAGGGFERAYSGVREITASTDSLSARAILHIADLERIVSAVRTQLSAGGRHVVTIELQRSVLEGLQVKLSAGADRSVTAEFIAASERVRAQLDARATELAEILRSRGINLAALSTSTAGADTSGQNHSARDGASSYDGEHASRVRRDEAGARVAEDTSETAGGDGTETTYRA